MLTFLIATNMVLCILLGAALAVLFDLRRLVPQKAAEPAAPAMLLEADDDDPGAPDSDEPKPSTPTAYNW